MTIVPRERRSVNRYPLELVLTSSLLKGRRVLQISQGKTRNMSSKGVLFAGTPAYAPGDIVWLSIRWPAAEGMELSVVGRVVRSDQSGTAIQILHHEFFGMAPASAQHPASVAPSKDLTPGGRRRSTRSGVSSGAWRSVLKERMTQLLQSAHTGG